MTIALNSTKLNVMQINCICLNYMVQKRKSDIDNFRTFSNIIKLLGNICCGHIYIYIYIYIYFDIKLLRITFLSQIKSI